MIAHRTLPHVNPGGGLSLREPYEPTRPWIGGPLQFQRISAGALCWPWRRGLWRGVNQHGCGDGMREERGEIAADGAAAVLD